MDDFFSALDSEVVPEGLNIIPDGEYFGKNEEEFEAEDDFDENPEWMKEFNK